MLCKVCPKFLSALDEYTALVLGHLPPHYSFHFPVRGCKGFSLRSSKSWQYKMLDHTRDKNSPFFPALDRVSLYDIQIHHHRPLTSRYPGRSPLRTPPRRLWHRPHHQNLLPRRPRPRRRSPWPQPRYLPHRLLRLLLPTRPPPPRSPTTLTAPRGGPLEPQTHAAELRNCQSERCGEAGRDAGCVYHGTC